MRNQQRRRRALVGLVFLLAVSILFECWQATAAAAKAGGRPMPNLWPVTLEGFLVVLILVYWEARSEHRKAPLARLLLAAITLVAAGVQALAAPQTWLGWVTAAVTPVILTGAVEFSVWLFYGGAVAALERTPREGTTPRLPGQAAGGVAVIGGHTDAPSGTPVANESQVEALQRLSGIPATPPPSTPVPATVDADSLTAGEAGSLPDRPRPVTPAATPPTDRDPTVPRLLPKDEEALRRQKDNPLRFERIIIERELDRDAALALATRRGWAAANGHREQGPA